MTPEAQRIAIAEARLGKRFVLQRGKFYELHTESCPQPFSCHWEGGRGYLVETSIPDYLNDLNAMHEVEKTLCNNQFHGVNYSHEVFRVVTGLEWKGDMGYFLPMVIYTTAAQRAEAFLRVKGLWIE